MLVILATLLTSGILGEDNITTTSTESTHLPTTTSLPTTIPPSPTTTTSEPTTVPTTSTPEPTTTTESTTTVSSTTSVVTTDVPSTTAPSPPAASDCSWNITQNNVTCMRIMIKAVFTIPLKERKEYIALTQNASTDESDCQFRNDSQKLVLSEPDYTFTMIFVKEGGKVFVNSTSFSYILPEKTGEGETDKKLFAVRSGNSYKCKAAEDIGVGNVTMEISNVQVQAFGEKDNTGFGAVEECDADDKVSDAVPIAVGCALAALIIIVLIAYLVGRRQTRQKGYQSV